MILLCLIGKKETYGYEIITELNHHGAAVLGYAKEGTVYPILLPPAKSRAHPVPDRPWGCER